MDNVTICLTMPQDDASDFAQLVKRLLTRNIGPGQNNLNLVTREEYSGASDALIVLRDALADAGFSPR